MVGEFIKELKVINEIRKGLSVIVETGTREGIDDYYRANEMLNQLTEIKLNNFLENELKSLPEIFQ